MGNLPTKRSKQIDEYLNKMTASRGRLIFALDATMSRQPTWDKACQQQGEMFAEAGKIGTLEIQVVYYRGLNEFRATGWTTNERELARQMSGITCKAGETQIARILAHIRKEHALRPVSAAVFIGDAMEGDDHGKLCDAAAGLGVPLFLFQEGDDPKVEKAFREMAGLTDGAYEQFDSSAASKFAELLRAVAAYATGGTKALENLNTESARKLLTQLK